MIAPADRLAIADAVIRPGQVDVYEWRDEGDRRHVVLLCGHRPHPWAVFARAKRKTSGLPYATWQAMMKDHVKAALLRSGTAPYPRTAVLGLAMAFGARSEHAFQQRATSVRSFDLRNLEKSFEDVLSGGLMFHDDAQVRYGGPSSARDTTADYCAAHLWDGDIGWQSGWAANSVPEVIVSRGGTVPLVEVTHERA